MSPSILIADDSELVRDIIRAFLEKNGYSVCGEAEDGLQAVENARKLKPDLIVLDLAMPRMNGVDAAAAIRTILPQVPIILFTMHEAPTSQSLASFVGINLVVSKPDGIGKLVDGVKMLLGVPRIPNAQTAPISNSV